MKRMTFAITILFVAGFAFYSVVAQPPGGGRGPGGPGGPDGIRPPPHPLEEALDTDGDHQLSAKEIENAVAALKTLDKNENGKIDEDELRPRFGGRPGGPGGPGRGGPDGPGGRDAGPDGPPRDREAGRPSNNDDMLARVLSFDKNEDGKLTKDEIPERMRGLLTRGDTNGDGALDKEELAKIAASFQGQGAGRRPEGAGPDGRGPGGPDGPPRPETIVENALRFDADGDGKLSRDELLEYAKQMIQRRGGQGRPEGRGPEGGDRPGGRPGGRPQRPDAE
ncbi:MAG: EF-hand domain-containing protein [Planctomycetota bacterium]|nr:EF-hand domain-containing protein [Planctomycetota bacterium]